MTRNEIIVACWLLLTNAALVGCVRRVATNPPSAAVHALDNDKGFWVVDERHSDIVWIYVGQIRDLSTAQKEIGCGKKFYCQPGQPAVLVGVKTTPKESK